MWSRAELKTSAKQILQKNYWGAVVVALVLGIVGGSIRFTGVFNAGGFRENIQNSRITDMSNNVIDGIPGYGYYNDVAQKIMETITGLSYMRILIILALMVVIMIAAIAISAFVLAPLEMGCRRWMLKNRIDNPPYNEIASGFGEGYLNIVKIMFCRNLFVRLWSLLFVIPGIVKSYEYKMIPYLLAENPNMSMSEAFQRSKNMMYNNKMDAFVLDLSFIGWYFFSMFTCGILSIFFINPYVHLTQTELYVTLCGTPGNQNQQTGPNGQYDSSGEQFDSYHEV